MVKLQEPLPKLLQMHVDLKLKPVAAIMYGQRARFLAITTQHPSEVRIVSNNTCSA